MDRARLKQLVVEFATLAMDSIPVQYSDDSEPSLLTLPEILKTWAIEPECLLSPMFLGYCLGEGEDINAFSPETLHLAIVTMSELQASTVEFDWIGECDVTSKPN